MGHCLFMTNNTLTKIKNYLTYISSIGLITVSQVAIAAQSGQDLKTIVGNVKTNITSLISLLIIISYIAGVGFALAGILQFKAHKDNPTQVPLSKPIVLLAVAACLLFLPSIMSTAGRTVFGSGAKDIGSSAVDSVSVPAG